MLIDMPDPFTIAVIKDDCGAMVQRSYVLNALNIAPSQKAHKLLLSLPSCAMILRLLHKSWQADVE